MTNMVKINEQLLLKRVILYKKSPQRSEPRWYRTYWNIRARCRTNPPYIKKGIKCLITKEELKKLWFRDKAYLMQKSSIDRIDSEGHYIFNNCRYIELSENCKRKRKKRTTKGFNWIGRHHSKATKTKMSLARKKYLMNKKRKIINTLKKEKV